MDVEGYDDEEDVDDVEDVEDDEENGVEEPKKLGIDVDLPTNGKTHAVKEVAANGDEADD